METGVRQRETNLMMDVSPPHQTLTYKNLPNLLPERGWNLRNLLAPPPDHRIIAPTTKNYFSCETSASHKPQTSSSVPSMHRVAASVHGFPLIKRKVMAGTRVSEKQVCEEQKKLEERLLELERRGVQLETEMRRCSNESLLVDWFLLINKKNMLVRRDTELVYMVRQQRLEDQQAEVEFEIRRLFNKPEQDWSSDDKHQEHELMSRLLSIIQQRNDIISSLDQDRQREQEEDVMLTAVIQRMELLTQTNKSRRSFKHLQMFKKSSRKTENSSRRKKKDS